MNPCILCSTLADEEYGRQKFGWPDHDVNLPPAASQLEVVRDFRPLATRKRQLLRCPLCGTDYLFETDYEYLAGTEDEQFLKRLTPEQTNEILHEPQTRPTK